MRARTDTHAHARAHTHTFTHSHTHTQDKALRATQAVGAVLGRHHARLAKNPSIGFLISNPMIIQLVCVVGLMQLSKR